MLISKRYFVFLTGLLVLLLAIGCQPKVKIIPKVELARSDEIQFMLKNGTSGNLRILSAQNPTSDPHLGLAPDRSEPIRFYLIRVANLEEIQPSLMKPVRGSETNMIITEDKVSYVGVQGEDGLIRMRTEQDQLWELLLDIQYCFDSQNVVEEIIISGPPDPILPTAVCE